MLDRFPLVVAAFVATAVSLAQTPSRPRPTPPVAVAAGGVEVTTQGPRTAVDDAFRTPIHTGAGEYGIWASGADYKVSFHDGFAFYPYLGPDYEANLPLRWKGTSLRVGDEPVLLPEGSARSRHTAWRYEFDRGAVVEVYDVRPEGVEQSFVIPMRPAGDGDLVLRGDLDTMLRAQVVAAAPQELVFRGPRGEALVRYGQATVIDAAGRRADVATRFDGRAVELVVARDFVRSATWPVVVDPLVRRVQISYSSSASPVLTTDVGRDATGVAHSVLVSYARAFSATDYDGYARMTLDDMSGSVSVFADTAAGWSTMYLRNAFVSERRMWVIAMDHVGGIDPGVFVHVHRSGDLTLSTTQTKVPGSTTRASRPDVGGTLVDTLGRRALVVYSIEGTLETDLEAFLVDPMDGVSAPVMTGPLPVARTPAGTLGVDREWPVVTQVSSGNGTSWIVGWQEHGGSTDDWDIHVSRITAAGAFAGEAEVGRQLDAFHCLHPQICGGFERFLVTYAVRDNGGVKYPYVDGPELEVERFDWSESSAVPTRIQRTVVALAPSAETILNCDVAFDYSSWSHWCCCYSVGLLTGPHVLRALRTGAHGCVVDALLVSDVRPASSFGGSCAFDDRSDNFKLTWATMEVGATPMPVNGDQYAWDPAMGNYSYGGTCSAATLLAWAPKAGNEYFGMAIDRAAPGQLALLLISPARIPPLGLGFLGMNTCFLNVDPVALIQAFLFLDGTGYGDVTFSLPDCPALFGNLYFQWVYADPTTPWPLKLRATAGIESRIR